MSRMLGCVLIAVGLAGCGEPRAPDVVLMVVDTLRADHLGAYGYSRATSPQLDRFAAEAIVFEDVVSPAPWTLPAVASMLTSTYPSVHGLRSRSGDKSFKRMRDGFTTIADAFAAAGYRTVAIGTNPWVNTRGHGLQQGFESYEPLVKEQARTVNHRVRAVLEMDDPRPVFLYVHYMDVHGPYLGHYNPSLPDLGPIDERYARKLDRLERFKLPPYLSIEGAGDLGTYVDAYDKSIRGWDNSFGRLMAWLDETGRADRTIVTVTSDHGEEFLEHGGWNHGDTVFDEQIRIPWILRAPRERARRVGGLKSLLDLAPTILSLSGVPVPTTMRGLDALEAGGTLDRAVFSESHIRQGAVVREDGSILVAMRRGGKKWIVYRRQRSCFDLEKDPLEASPADCDANQFDPVLDWMEEMRQTAESLGKTGEFEASAEERQQLRELGYAE
jgi:arylsulfatase